jgi:putative DNA primase/helicase
MTDFATFARAHGLLLDHAEASTRIRRCGTEDKPRSKNGAYWFDGDRGWVQRWDEGGELYWWDDPNKPEPTPEMRAEWARKRAEYERKQLAAWGRTALQCKMLQEQTRISEHNYMHYKGLGDYKVRVLDKYEFIDSDGVVNEVEHVLFVPMINFETEAMVGAQLIWWVPAEMRYEKKFVPGSRLRHSAYRLGAAATNEVILCEGLATGVSIEMALKQMNLRATIVVCFNDSNLVNIAALLPKDIRAYVFADNDKSKAGAIAARKTGLPWCQSPVEGEDANDLHVRAGLTPVAELIRQVRAPKPVQLECDDPVLQALLDAA